jgi:RNA polymerase sigma-70 factor (ECF subfamily)
MTGTNPARPEQAETEEDRLVAQAQVGSAEAFGALYSRYLPLVYRFVLTRVRDEKLAEDITASVFMRAWDSIGKHRGQELRFRPWIFRIARNAIIDHFRSNHPAARLPDADCAPSPESQADVDAAQVWAALQQLDEEAQTLLILRFFLGCSHAEVAAILGKSEGACRMIQLRALRAMALALGKEGDK